MSSVFDFLTPELAVRLDKLEELVLAMAEVMATKPRSLHEDAFTRQFDDDAALCHRLSEELKARRAARKENNHEPSHEHRTDDQSE